MSEVEKNEETVKKEGEVEPENETKDDFDLEQFEQRITALEQRIQSLEESQMQQNNQNDTPPASEDDDTDDANKKDDEEDGEDIEEIKDMFEL